MNNEIKKNTAPHIRIYHLLNNSYAGLIKQNTALANIKIMGVSATLRQKELRKQFCDLCDDFIPKPVDTDLLFEKIKGLLGIEWIEEDNSGLKEMLVNEKIVFPEKEMTESITELAEIGDYNSIHKMMEYLLIANKEYKAFCSQIIKHVKNYDRKGIFQVLKQIEE